MASYDVAKQRAQILTVDPSNRVVEGILKDQATVRIAIWDIGAFFRWPKQGEFWTINYVNNNWMLGEYVGTNQDADVSTIEDIKEGSALISVPSGNLHLTSLAESEGVRISASGPLDFRAKGDQFGIILESGKLKEMVGKCVYIVGTDPASTVYTIVHQMETQDIVYSVRTIATGTTPAFTGQILDENTLQITFTVAPAVNGAAVTIIG